mmetsp:Transcript_58173/g.108926  ORF Transcript_58173/g.108926 Transcript_58173/m.108926 type:complete len:99 (-) Transcript_58173:48-344(-)
MQQIDAAVLNSILTNVAMKAAFGSVAFVPACVLFRGRGLRCLCGGLGIGFGAGLGWAQGDLHMRHPSLVPMPKSFEDEFQKLKASVLDCQIARWLSQR